MWPVTRLSRIIDHVRVTKAFPLSPVCRKRQPGLFLAYSYMFEYKVVCGLFVLASIGGANATEAATTAQQHEFASEAGRHDQSSDRLGWKAANSGIPATRATPAHVRVHALESTPGKNGLGAIADRGYRSVNAIGARRAGAATSLVQRQDRRFYMVRQALSQNDTGKTMLSNKPSRDVDTSRRVVATARVGNLLMDRSLLLKSATASRSGQ